jgi:acetyl esterase
MDEQVARLIEAMEARNATLPKMWTLSPAAARERVDALMAPMNVGGPSMAKQYDVAIPVRRGTVGATVYVPEAAPPISPGLLYLHGGGFVIMSPKTHDRLARELAAGMKTRVVSLDYGQAPDRFVAKLCPTRAHS